jgi:alpha-beta hydrolase superfamily lysophospholipase
MNAEAGKQESGHSESWSADKRGIGAMGSKAIKLLKLLVVLLSISVVALLGMRAWDAERSPPLAIWHTYTPDDLRAGELQKLEWVDYIRAENALFDEVRTEVTQKLEPEDRIPSNRYFDGSPIYPGNFKTDWNRSYILEPETAPVGAVVLLHGLTDSPYSLRHLARRYREHGFIAVAIRLPGHGTVPSGLTDVNWEDWSAATGLAVREARRRIGPSRPLHLVGFSNGGALAMKYALDALGDKTLTRADRIVLISPMIGITAFARFAGIFGWPAVFPAFANAAWLSVTPEFNPFKYNSFPINGARQSSLLTRVLQEQIASDARANRLAELPPILTFQSVVDFTVSTRAVISALYGNLPANGSELVLFDLNRNALVSPLLRANVEGALDRLVPAPPRRYRTTIITNAGPDTGEVVERVVDAGATTERSRMLGLTYPREVYSLSHVAIPFPVSDALYGMDPGTDEDFGVNLGTMTTRGEVGVLILPLDSLVRMASNPFFPYMRERIEEGIGGRAESPSKAASGLPAK